MNSIPKKIWTIWLGNEMPDKIKECISTQTLDGYKHTLLDNQYIDNMSWFYSGIKYFRECYESKKWAKAADFLRMFILEQEGGIYLDADVKVLKPFDDLLNQDMFVGAEENGFVSNAIVGSIPKHPILTDYLGKVERNFIGSGDLVFQPGMFLWTEIVRYSTDVTIYPPEYFLPYNHHMDRLLVTDNTYTIHYFNKSWVKT